MKKNIAFFLANAAYSYDPKCETPKQGRERTARELAEAEQWARNACVWYDWQIDQDMDSSEFSDEKPAWKLWSCAAFNRDNVCLASCTGIDLGRDGILNDPYVRVMQAELAREAKDREITAERSMSLSNAQLDQLLLNISEAPSNDEEIAALHKVIDELRQHIDETGETSAAEKLKPLVQKAARWAATDSPRKED